MMKQTYQDLLLILNYIEKKYTEAAQWHSSCHVDDRIPLGTKLPYTVKITP